MAIDGKTLITKSKSHSPREAAFLAVFATLKEEQFASNFLESWRNSESPSSADFHLAQEIAYGTIRMALSLDYLAAEASQKKKLSLKLKEKALLRTAVYQMFFLERIPSYAVVNETVAIAKQHFHSVFSSFLNALLRNLSSSTAVSRIMPLPEGKSPKELSIRYSYPQFFVEKLIHDYGLEKSISIMEAENRSSPTMLRVRDPNRNNEFAFAIKKIEGSHLSVAEVIDSSAISKIAASSDYYIQNVTPIALIEKLSLGSSQPETILDLCSAPGGKLLLAHDLYPKARLYANDVNPQKLALLQQNIDKYGLQVDVSCGPGENYPGHGPFDLIILDVPCSNTGVLNKRPEARWRLSKESISALKSTQIALLQKAFTLLSEKGEVWYLTCSILKQENEEMIRKACNLLHAQSRTMETIVPSPAGWDGGFGCAIVPMR